MAMPKHCSNASFNALQLSGKADAVRCALVEMQTRRFTMFYSPQFCCFEGALRAYTAVPVGATSCACTSSDGA
jgi:hypothetical protein